MTKRKIMTDAQRQQHFQNWSSSEMSKNEYARLNGINTKTFHNLCRSIEVRNNISNKLTDSKIDESYKIESKANIELTENATLVVTKDGFEVNASPAVIVRIIRALKLC